MNDDDNIWCVRNALKNCFVGNTDLWNKQKNRLQNSWKLN